MMKTQGETSIQRAFNLVWFLGIFFVVLVSWVPRYGIAQESGGSSAWVANTGNPVVALAVLNDAIQGIEKPENRVIRDQNGFFATTSVGHNYSRSYMFSFLNLLESRSNELQVVNTIKDEKFTDFRKSLARVKDENEDAFRNHFDSFLALLKEVRFGIIDQLVGSQNLNNSQIESLTIPIDPFEFAKIVSKIQGAKSRARSVGISCRYLL